MAGKLISALLQETCGCIDLSLKCIFGSKDTSMHNMDVNDLVSNFGTRVCRDRNGRSLDNGVHRVRRLSRKTERLVFDNFFPWETEEVGLNDASLDWLSIWSPHLEVNGVSQCISSSLKSKTTTAILVWKWLNRCWLGLHVLPSSSWWSFSISPSLRIQHATKIKMARVLFFFSTTHPWLSGLSLCGMLTSSLGYLQFGLRTYGLLLCP